MSLKWIPAAVALCLAPLLLATNQNTGPGTNQRKATGESAIVLQSMLPSHCVFMGNFQQQKTITGIYRPLLSLGHLFFSCHHGLIWKTRQPFTESVIYTTKNLHFRTNHQIDLELLTGSQHAVIAKLLINLMSADTGAISSDFILGSNLSGENSEVTDSLQLTPKSNPLKKAIESISIEKIETQKIRIEIVDNSGQKTTISLSDLREFSKPEGSITQLCNRSLPKDRLACDALAYPQRQRIHIEEL